MTQQLLTPDKLAQELRDFLNHHAGLYHTLDVPQITDEEYDQAFRKLKKLEKTHPGLAVPESPTQRVGAPVAAGFDPVEHPEPMLSLSNAFTKQEFEAWLERTKQAGDPNPLVCAEPKIDGLAVRLRYEQGRLVMGATRGDGSTGEDVTHNVRTVRNIPLVLLPTGNFPIPSVLELRGEIYMPRSTFERVNQEREERGEYQYANPRNAAAGAMRQLDPKLAHERGLLAWVYSCQNSPHPSHFGTLHWLHDLGLPVNPLIQLCAGADEADAYHHELSTLRDSLDYEIDGMVAKIDRLEAQRLLGHTGHDPRWAVAWKFEAEQATTRLLDIRVSHGRFGRLTPVAVLEPVQVGGVTVQSASLHNEEDVHRKDIRAGDEVIIQRAGDVIPQVTGPTDHNPDRETPVFKMPDQCPTCRTPVSSPEDEAGHWCLNDSCASRLPEQLRHFVSKRAMDIEGLGDHWCDALIEAGMVQNPADVYQLTRKQLLQLDRMGEKLADRVLRNVERSKEQPMDRVLYSLGIFRLGREVSGLLARRYPSVDRVALLSARELAGIDGIGPKIAQSVVEGFQSDRVMETMAGMEAAGVRMQQQRPIQEKQTNTQESSKMNEDFANKTFVVTGKLTGMTREEAETAIQARGGNAGSSVTGKTDHLVVGDKPGSKMTKAQKLGVPIMSEDEFFQLLDA